MNKYGYLPDSSERKSDFTRDLAPKLTQTFVGDVDLRPFCTETNQYNLSACAANATADSVEIVSAVDGKPQVQLARLFVYNLARNMTDQDGDGHSDLDTDDGTYIRLCFDVLSKFGVCREDIPAGQGGWPYDVSKVFTLPDMLSMRAATAHRIHSYYSINETGDARLSKMLEALRGSHPIVFGTSIDNDFEGIRGMLPWSLTGASIGGHAMVVVGYIEGKGFIVKNSWGRDWGNNGFCVMKPEVFLSQDTQDLWVPTSGSVFK